jgi:hypothetical protein
VVAQVKIIMIEIVIETIEMAKMIEMIGMIEMTEMAKMTIIEETIEIIGEVVEEEMGLTVIMDIKTKEIKNTMIK